MDEYRVGLLFVCTANICRSPMAEAFARRHGERLDVGIEVASASVSPVRRRIHPTVRAILEERRIQPGSPMSQPISASLVRQADVVLTMTGDHAVIVGGHFRDQLGKVFTIDHFAREVQPQLGDLAGPATSDDRGWTDRLYRTARQYPEHPGMVDIVDPMGQDESVFRTVAQQLDQLTESIVAGFSTSPEVRASARPPTAPTSERATRRWRAKWRR